MVYQVLRKDGVSKLSTTIEKDWVQLGTFEIPVGLDTNNVSFDIDGIPYIDMYEFDINEFEDVYVDDSPLTEDMVKNAISNHLNSVAKLYGFDDMKSARSWYSSEPKMSVFNEIAKALFKWCNDVWSQVLSFRNDPSVFLKTLPEIIELLPIFSFGENRPFSLDYAQELIQKVLDDKSIEYGYDNMLSVRGWASVPTYDKQSEAIALSNWAGQVWSDLRTNQGGIYSIETLMSFVIEYTPPT